MIAGEMKNLKSRKLYLQVYDEIKNYIHENNLLPGDKLPSEMKMCEMLGVSRNVLREAIKSLEITGAVSSTPGVGIVIQELNTDYILSRLVYNVSNPDSLVKQIEQLRRVLEVGFAEHAYNSVTEQELAILGHQVDAMKTLGIHINNSQTQVLGSKFAEADAAFHKALFKQVDNDLLKSIIDFFWACDKYYKAKATPEDVDLTIKKHAMVYDALLSRDYDAFSYAMNYHFTVAYFK